MSLVAQQSSTQRPGVGYGDGGTGGSGLVGAGVFIKRWWEIFFGLTPVSSSFRNEGAVTMVSGESLVGLAGDVTISMDSSAGGSGEGLYLSSSSTIGGSASLFGGREGPDNGGGVRHPSACSSSTDSGSVTMLSADTGGACLYTLQHNNSPTQDTR